MHPEMILDEGGLLAVGMVPGIDKPVALISTAEKGFVTVELTAHAQGGHSSMPPATTSSVSTRRSTPYSKQPG